VELNIHRHLLPKIKKHFNYTGVGLERGPLSLVRIIERSYFKEMAAPV
jgi:hypothetical protein